MKNIFKNRILLFGIFLLTLSLSVFSFFLFKQYVFYVALPTKFQSNQLPYIEVTIEGNSYPIIVDLGSRLEMDLHENLLAQLDYKTPFATEKWKNLQGKEFEYPTYLLPKIELGTLILKKPLVIGYPKEIEKAYLVNPDVNSLSSQEVETVGYLGRGLLKKMNLLLDFKKSTIILTHNLNKLKKNNYLISNFVKIPFELNPKGIIFEALTDLGKLRFLLDTGCTATLLHTSLYPENQEKKKNRYGLLGYTTNQFNIQGVDFEPQDLSFIEMTEELRVIDGLLGMDFIKNHVMYIDFPKKTLYIQK